MNGQQQRRRAAGFTLIEVLAVLAILGLALGLAIGRGPMRSARLEARAGAGQFADALRRAGDRAIASGIPVLVVIDPQARLYATDGEKPRIFARDLSIALLPGTANVAPGKAGIMFSPDGSASGGGMRFETGHHALRVEVEWLTGRVFVRDAS